MNTAKDRIAALAAIVPNEVIAFLTAHHSAKTASEDVFKKYEEAFAEYPDLEGKWYFVSDECSSRFEQIEDKLWSRACIALGDWIYENFYNGNNE